ncbi:MAG TPA: GerMN domain-containing protein [Ilumatobacteraceae bacterium]|nr:GerMN domain-containing protein [Ilumatobacteraceae bacterium]
MLRRLTVITLVLVAFLVGCGIPDSGDVSRIPDNKIGALNDTLPTTSTSTTTPATIEPTTTTIQAESTTSTIATEDVTLYYISGAILVPFARPMRKGASSPEVLQALQEGPPTGDNAVVGLRTAVPTKDEALMNVTEDGSGVATVILPTNFYDTVKQEDQRLAIGQIVLTLTEVGRIGQVRFTLGGQPIGVFRGSGDLSQPGEPLPPRDYLELLEGPVVTTTTTTTTTVPLTTPTTVV